MKTLAIALAFLTLSPLAIGQGARHDNVAYQYIANGNSNMVGSIPNALITVCNGLVLPVPGQTCTGLATIYSDNALTQVLQNPTNADGFGNYGFYTLAGSYQVSVSGVGLITYTYPLKLPCTLDGNCTFTGNITFTGTVNIPGGTSLILPLPLTKNSFTNFLTAVTLTGARTWTLQDTSDTFVFLNTSDILTNKTIDASVNTIKWSTNTAGHYLRNNGGNYVDNTIQVADVPFTYQGNTTKLFTCTGAFTAGHLVTTDGSGNCIDAGAPSTIVTKFATAAGCTTGSASYSTCDNTLTWSGGAFADTSYYPMCFGVDPNIPASGGSSGESPTLVVRSFTTSQIVVSTMTQRAVTATFTQINCSAMHP
jgi:hypothetical protein